MHHTPARAPERSAGACVALKLGAAQALQGDIRQGLAELLGEPDFVSRLQAATVATEHYESQLTLDDLPPLTVFTPAPKPEPPRPVRTQTDRIVAIQIENRLIYDFTMGYVPVEYVERASCVLTTVQEMRALPNTCTCAGAQRRCTCQEAR